MCKAQKAKQKGSATALSRAIMILIIFNHKYLEKKPLGTAPAGPESLMMS